MSSTSTPQPAGFPPEAPTTRVPPTRVGTDTWVVHQVQHALGAPLCVYLNSMVIASSEPAIIDTGSVNNREQWLQDVFSIVEPADVRRVFLSHEDHDHTGNLPVVLDACSNASLVCSWAVVERFSNAFGFPLHRCRWLNDGEAIDIGDRRIVAIRPPVYDSPSTRGFLDERSRVYWAADAFAAPCPAQPVPTVNDLDPAFWAEGMAMFIHHALSPWLGIVDPTRYAAEVERVRSLGMTTIASGHSPLITGPGMVDAFRLLRDLPNVPIPSVPGQTELEAILSAAATKL